MNITVNGMLVSEPAKEVMNLEDLLIELTEGCLPHNHLVGTVLLNGNNFSETYAGQARDIEIANVLDLEVTTVPLGTFACAAIQDCSLFLAKISKCAERTSELFRMADEGEANEQYATLIESLRALYHFIDQAQQAAQWDFTTSMHKGEPVQAYWMRMQSIVDELKQIQEEGDWILLADILEYELVPLLDNWKHICKAKATELH